MRQLYLSAERSITGYIHKNDVDSTKPSFVRVCTAGNNVCLFSTSTASKVLKSYNAGTVLKYRPYNSNWYEATVYVNGKKQQGFIYADDVADSMPTLTGLLIKALQLFTAVLREMLQC